jgi:hypothetical protein
MSTGRKQRLVTLVIAGLAVVALSAVAVEALGDVAVGALLGVLVVIAVLGLVQQMRYARRSAATAKAVASVDRRVTKMAKGVTALSKEATAQSKAVTALSRNVATWSKEARMAEIETGIAALNRYVALGTDDSVDRT